MKVILAGLGRFGIGWYRLLHESYPQLTVTVVEPDRERAAAFLIDGDACHPTLQDALDHDRPDFVLNLTPPAVHTAINHLAFDHRLPVLCEKPIAEDWADSVEIVARAVREGIPFMIAENYRRAPLARTVRAIVDGGEIGELAAVYVQFFRDFYDDKPYLLAMPEPLLVEVAVHHLDLMRYLTGSEGWSIWARSYRPANNPYPGRAALTLLLDMQSGVTGSYTGNLAARGPETEWLGIWRMEGSEGMLLAEGDTVRVIRGKQEKVYRADGKATLPAALDDFLRALRDGREPETSARDYLRTQALVHYAAESSRAGRMLEIDWREIEAIG